jgi:hypothetical protein
MKSHLKLSGFFIDDDLMNRVVKVRG